jgi:hypothetical protein
MGVMIGAREGGASFVAEMQGLLGPYSFPEKLLQKIWLRGDFDHARASTTDGRHLYVLHPGKWNLLGGPDFHGARLRFGDPAGSEVHGDVEVHLHSPDWDAHAHADDPTYDRVILHVVLFPPPRGHRTRGAGGREIPVLALLPLLHRGLEEFAADEAVEVLANRPLTRLPDELGRLPASELSSLLQRHAARRWQEKIRFARLRVEALGWNEACHHAGLEILGFRFNRAPMLRIAGRWPLADWAGGRVSADEAYHAEAEAWSLQGVRPANQPRVRLRQYACWTTQRPDWPERLRSLAEGLPVIVPAQSPPEVRRTAGLGRLRERWRDEIVAGAVGGTRFDTLVCDGLLPLLGTILERDVEGIWFQWFPGNLPAVLSAGLRQLGFGDGRTQPFTNGVAQGLLGWLLAHDATR